MEKTKQQLQIEQRFLYNLARILEAFPQYSISQHLLHFMRRKGDKKDPYFWTSEATLQKIEAYYDELIGELSNKKREDYE